MKRLITIFLVCFYLLPAIGFSINIHWCCNKISSISFGTPTPNKCKACKATKNCCKDVHLVIKITDNQYGSSALVIHENHPDWNIPIINEVAFSNLTQKSVFDFSSYHAPPYKSKQPVYLANSVFRV